MFAVSKYNDMQNSEFRKRVSLRVKLKNELKSLGMNRLEIDSLVVQARFESIRSKTDIPVSDFVHKRMQEKIESLKSQS